MLDTTDLDQRVTLRNIAWKDLEALIRMRDPDDPVRATYMEGALELVHLSRLHQATSRRLNALLAAFSVERGLGLVGSANFTIKQAAVGRAIEPDGCYVLGERSLEEQPTPSIAVDVVMNPGGIPRLEVYRGLGVQEVWFWREEQLKYYALRSGGFERVERSELLPALDPDLLARFMSGSHDLEAVQAFRHALRVVHASPG